MFKKCFAYKILFCFGAMIVLAFGILIGFFLGSINFSVEKESMEYEISKTDNGLNICMNGNPMIITEENPTIDLTLVRDGTVKRIEFILPRWPELGKQHWLLDGNDNIGINSKEIFLDKALPDSYNADDDKFLQRIVISIAEYDHRGYEQTKGTFYLIANNTDRSEACRIEVNYTFRTGT